MGEIKIKYVYQHDDTGRIVNRIFDISEIENGEGGENFLPRYTLVARCLSTGKKDKNGVEIYGGDIILWEKSNGELEKSEVVFFQGAFRLRNMNFCLYDYMDSNIFEVIGNYGDSDFLECSKC